MEEFYYEEMHSKHIFLKCLIYIFVIGIAIGVFFYYKNANTIKLKNVTIEVGDTLSSNVEDYLSSGLNNKDDYKLYLDEVDVTKVGEYSYKVKYNKHTKSGIIKVRDTIKPIVILDDITIGVDEEFNTNLLLQKCEDYSLPCTVSFSNEKDMESLKNVGSYEIKFDVSDAYGNITESSTTITVSDTETLSSKMTNDLDYYTNSENDDTIGDIFFKKLDKAIYEDTLEYDGMIQEISSLDFNNYVEGEIYSTRLITAYNKYGYVIGIQVEVTLNDGNKKLLEDKVINGEE